MIDNLFDQLKNDGYNFFTGVPDSALKPFQNSILESNFEHIIATNEGQAVGIAFGAEIAVQYVISFPLSYNVLIFFMLSKLGMASG